MRSRGGWLLIALALVSTGARAVDLQDGRLSINGFGSWAYAASDDNAYHLARHTGAFSAGDFGLAVRGRLSEKAVVAGQLRLANGATLFLDWVFGEWRFSDRLRLRVGVIKHPFGIFGEWPNVGTLRPFYLLPSGIYGLTGFTGVGVDGVGISGQLPSRNRWELSYDLYGGSLKSRMQDVIAKVANPQGLKAGGTLSTKQDEGKYVLGGRLVLATPLEGLEARLSAYGTIYRDQDHAPRAVVGPSLQYVGEAFSARAEYFFQYEDGVQRTHTAYAEAAYFLTTEVQIGVRAEYYRLTPLGNVKDSSLFESRELAATLNYWFDPRLVLKGAVHAVDGNRFGRPLALDDALLGGGLKRQTLATILGMQFSF